MNPIFNMTTKSFYELYNKTTEVLAIATGIYTPSELSRQRRLSSNSTVKELVERKIREREQLPENVNIDFHRINIEDEKCNFNFVFIDQSYITDSYERLGGFVRRACYYPFTSDQNTEVDIYIPDLNQLADNKKLFTTIYRIFESVYRVFYQEDYKRSDFFTILGNEMFQLLALLTGIRVCNPGILVSDHNILDAYYDIIDLPAYKMDNRGFGQVSIDMDKELDFIITCERIFREATVRFS